MIIYLGTNYTVRVNPRGERRINIRSFRHMTRFGVMYIFPEKLLPDIEKMLS